MKIEEGRYYRSRDGGVHGPMIHEVVAHIFKTPLNAFWDENGSFSLPHLRDRLDLIEEVRVFPMTDLGPVKDMPEEDYYLLEMALQLGFDPHDDGERPDSRDGSYVVKAGDLVAFIKKLLFERQRPQLDERQEQIAMIIFEAMWFSSGVDAPAWGKLGNGEMKDEACAVARRIDRVFSVNELVNLGQSINDIQRWLRGQGSHAAKLLREKRRSAAANKRADEAEQRLREAMKENPDLATIFKAERVLREDKGPGIRQSLAETHASLMLVNRELREERKKVKYLEAKLLEITRAIMRSESK